MECCAAKVLKWLTTSSATRTSPTLSGAVQHPLALVWGKPEGLAGIFLWNVATKPPNSGVAIRLSPEKHRKNPEILTLLKLLLPHLAYQIVYSVEGILHLWKNHPFVLAPAYSRWLSRQGMDLERKHGRGGTEMATLEARRGWLPGDCHLIRKPRSQRHAMFFLQKQAVHGGLVKEFPCTIWFQIS